MKKHFVTLGMTLLMATLLVLVGCGGNDGAGAPGLSAMNTSLFSLLPADSSAVFAVNFDKFTKMKMFKQMEEKSRDKPGKGGMFGNYEDLMAKTGIDPKKDIHAIAVAVTGTMQLNLARKPDFVAVVNLDYDKAKIETLVKQSNQGLTYKGVSYFKTNDSSDVSFAFISDTIAVVGKTAEVMRVIDLSKGEGKSIADGKLKTHFSRLRQGAMFSFVVEFPKEERKVRDGGMLKFDLSKAEALAGHAYHTGSAWEGSIVLVSQNPEANEQLVTTLNGAKIFAMALGPEVGELIEGIKLSSSADNVTLTFSISDDLEKKLKEAAEKKMKGMM